MIPGQILLWLGRHWKLAATLAGTVLLFGWGSYWKADARRWQGRYDAKAVELSMMVSQVKTVTAEVYAKAAGRLLREERARNSITVEIARDYQDDLAQLRTRYGRLRAQVGAGQPAPGQSASVPSVPNPSRGYHACPGDPGLWCVSPEVATLLAQHADENTLQLERAQRWISKQGEVTIPLD